MRRLALSAGIVAALVLAAVALGAGSDVRIHRLHLPPPPVNDDLGGDQPAPPGTDGPTDPGTTTPPAPPSPPGAQPPAPPPAPPASSIGCTVAGDAPGADVTGTLSDYAISLSSASVAAAPAIHFRGNYPAGGDTHNLTLRTASGTKLCGTTDLPVGAAGTFTVTNLPPGSYELVCTLHVDFGMRVPFTVS